MCARPSTAPPSECELRGREGDGQDGDCFRVRFRCATVPDDAGGQYHFFNYKWCTRATFPDVREATSERDRLLRLLKRECRGLVFHEDAQGHVTVAARRFHKFFNIGERDDTHESLVDLSRPHRLLVKHDGSLVGPVLLPSGRVRFATKSGFGDITRMVEERFLSLPENAVYLRWSAEWLRGEPTHHVLPTSSLIGGGAPPSRVFAHV